MIATKEATGALHRRIEVELECKIISGEWPPGTRIPPEQELTAVYGCSRMTVNKALSALARAGLIHRRMGAGSFVATPNKIAARIEVRDIASEIRERGMTCHFTVLESAVRRATPSDRRLLSITKGKVLGIDTIYRADETSYALERRLINLEEVPGAADVDFSRQSPGAWLLSHSPWISGEHHISAVAADPETARALGVPEGQACLRVERWVWQTKGMISYAEQIFPAIGGHQIEARFMPTK